MKPYSVPNTIPTAGTKPAPYDLRYVRGVLSFHVSAILLCAAFTLSDNGRLNLPDVVATLFYIRAVQIPLGFTVMACPLAMAVAAVGLQDRSNVYRVLIVVLDVALSLFQVWATLPLVQ